MVKRKRDHLPLKQAGLVQLLFGTLMPASKASSTGFTPVQCLFSLSTDGTAWSDTPDKRIR